MKNRTMKFGSQRCLLRGSTTYLAKIAVALQDAPCRMLTFAQLMNKMAPLICEERKAVENNIRVCLSSNKCFVKVPVVPDSVDSRRNYWKLDYSQITAKMVRRHFKGILHLFPELASKVKTEKLSRPLDHQPAACRAVQVRCEVKFSSPFSIDSLLKRDSPTARASTASPLSRGTLRAEQQLQSAGIKRSFNWEFEERHLLQSPSGSSSMSSAGGSTHHGATGTAESIKRMSLCTEPSLPVYTSCCLFQQPAQQLHHLLCTSIYP